MLKPIVRPILQQTPKSNLMLISFVLLAGMTGCVGLAEPAGMPTPAQDATSPGPTATEIVWFPPTATMVVPTATTPLPTPERKPGVGELIIKDEMTSSTHWNAAASGKGSATISDSGLTLSAQPNEPAVVSLHRSAVFDNMYMEITARPSLCRGRDSYGLAFRAPNDVAHYRFIAACDGTVAAERISLGSPRILQPPMASADVPLGAPGLVRMGLWAVGSEFRFFLNGRYQFSSTDPSYASGGIGVFVQAGGQTAAVVTFSDLAVYRVSEPSADIPATP